MYEVNINKLLSYGLFEWMYYAFFASFVGFLPAYLLSCGVSSSLLSILVALFLGTSLLGSFFWGSLCDKLRTNKRVFIFELTASVITAVLIYFTAEINLWYPAVLYPLFGFLCTPLGTILDSWMLKSFNRDYGMFGKARAIGSIGYATASLVIGMMTKTYGYLVILYGALLFAAMSVLMAVVSKEEKYSENIASVKNTAKPTELLKVKPYMYMLGILFLTGLACAPINNLKIVFLENVGGDVGILGIDAFIGVMVQALFMFSSSFWKMIKPYVRLSIMSVFVLADLVLILVARNPIMIIVGTIMWNISFGIMLPTIREITEKTVSESLKSTAHTMADAIYYDFSGIVALSYSGYLMEQYSEKSLALLGAVVMIIPLLMSLVKIDK